LVQVRPDQLVVLNLFQLPHDLTALPTQLLLGLQPQVVLGRNTAPLQAVPGKDVIKVEVVSQLYHPNRSSQ
jgi:hypothetical protein